MTPRRDRKSLHTSDRGTVFVQFDAVVLPGDTHVLGRERLGRPARRTADASGTGDVVTHEFTDLPTDLPPTGR